MSTTPSLGSSAPALPSAAVLFLIWAFLFYLARIWSKIGKSDRWGSDGTAISLAVVMAIAHVVSIFYAWHRGYRPGWMHQTDTTDRAAIEKSLYAAQIFFVASIGLTRTSTALFTSRILTLGEQHRRLAAAMLTACVLSTPVLLLAIALRKPFAQPGSALDGSQEMFTRWLIIEIVGLLIDFSTLACSVIIIWRLQMTIWKRLTVCTLFAVRLLILPIVACRLAQLYPSAQPTYNSAKDILTEAELQLCLILASVTCLKPLFQPFHPGFFAAVDTNLAVTGYTNRPAGGGNNNNSNREAYYELGASRSEWDRKQPALGSSSRSKDTASDEIDLVAALRPDEGETWTEAMAGSNADASGVKGGGRGIAATRTWAVSYEERKPGCS